MKLQKKKAVRFDAFADLEDYTQRVLDSKKLGILTIGGGVPRNWAQQVGPYLDIISKRVGSGGGFKRFDYAVRICPEPVHWDGLSGCTYSEGVSWGKIRPRSEGGMYVEVMSDATIAWPLIIRAVMERLEKNGRIKL
jgi:deoxyhypusine synthase